MFQNHQEQNQIIGKEINKMKDTIRLQQLAGIITESQAKKLMEVLNEANQPYKVLSKVKEKSQRGDTMYDVYELELNNEDYTTPDNLTFNIQTIGHVMIDSGEELDLDNPYHNFYYIQTDVYDKNGKRLTYIPGSARYRYGSFDVKPSIAKAKKWLDQRGTQLMSGKGFQHKST